MKTNYTKAFMALLFMVGLSKQAISQSYFAGTSAGAGNTGPDATAVGSQTLRSGNSGTRNAAFGFSALKSNKTGSYNVAIGSTALIANTAGDYNTGIGYASQYYNINGYSNTGIGYKTLFSNVSGIRNVAVGANSLYYNDGIRNTGVGDGSLYSNKNGSNNSALGAGSLITNTYGNDNCAFGYESLYNNTVGNRNIAIGTHALFGNKNGSENISIGQSSLLSSDGTFQNIAIGTFSMYYKNSGSFNVGIGDSVLISNNGLRNVALGSQAGQLSKGNYNTFIGALSDLSTSTNYFNSTAIGYNAKVNASNKVRIGNTSVTSIGGQVGWSTSSDRRLKSNIQESKLGLDFILDLKPVTYNYTDEGQKGIEYTGLIAQDIDDAATKLGVNDFSAVDKNGEYWAVRYGDLTVPLIKATQELNKKLEEKISQLEKEIADLKSEILTANKSSFSTQNQTSGIKRNEIFQNTPNPFKESTTIRFSIADASARCSITIRNIKGAIVKQINDINVKQGSLKINAFELSSGTYTYTLVVNGETIDTKLMVIGK